MRVSTLMLLGALATMSAAEVLKGRALHGEESDTRSVNGYTRTFTYEADTRGPPETFEGMYQYGLVIGMISTWAFLLFGFTVIIIDECRRHARFKLEVLTDERKLRTTYGCSEDDMQYYEKEF